MLIRVRPDLYINTEQIVAVLFYDSYAIFECVLPLSNYKVSQEAAHFVCEMMEANTAAILPEDKDSEPEKPTLKARIAQALRDTWKGATFGQIDAVFPDAGIPAITAALIDLQTENVIIAIPQPQRHDGITFDLYYHASSSETRSAVAGQPSGAQSAPPTPNPDLSTATAAPPDALHQVAEHNES